MSKDLADYMKLLADEKLERLEQEREWYLRARNEVWRLASTVTTASALPGTFSYSGSSFGGLSDDPNPAKLTLPVTKTVGAIRGYRAWRISHDERGVALQSAHVGTIWDGPLMVADAPPEDGYTSAWHSHVKDHGIYAATSFKPLDYRAAGVYGEVMLWGRVVVHESGYRAERAMIRRLVVVDHFALLRTPSLPDLLEKRYGCNVSTDIRSLLTKEE